LTEAPEKMSKRFAAMPATSCAHSVATHSTRRLISVAKVVIASMSKPW